MNAQPATLIALRSKDGFWEMEDGVRLGMTYMVDLDTKRTELFFNKPAKCHFHAEVVDEVEGDRYLPTELLIIGRVQ